MTRSVAFLIGIFGTALGVLGLVAPHAFASTIAFMQAPPWLYLAAAVRISVGAVLFRVAPKSRYPVALRILGTAVAIGGILTPVMGVWAARVILDRWSAGGDGLIRAWAAVTTGFGVFITFAVATFSDSNTDKSQNFQSSTRC